MILLIQFRLLWFRQLRTALLAYERTNCRWVPLVLTKNSLLTEDAFQHTLYLG